MGKLVKGPTLFIGSVRNRGGAPSRETLCGAVAQKLLYVSTHTENVHRFATTSLLTYRREMCTEGVYMLGMNATRDEGACEKPALLISSIRNRGGAPSRETLCGAVDQEHCEFEHIPRMFRRLQQDYLCISDAYISRMFIRCGTSGR